MASLLGAISSVSALASQVWGYFKGSRTQEQETTLSEAEHWQRELRQAIQGGDWAHASYALDALRELRDKTAATRKP